MASSRSDDEYAFEFLPEVREEVRVLPAGVRRRIAELVVELHRNPYLGDPLDDRPPKVLDGCRKVRFDVDTWPGQPRYRLIYRNEPSDGAVGLMVVLAIGERRNMIAYAKARARMAARTLAESGREQVRRRSRSE